MLGRRKAKVSGIALFVSLLLLVVIPVAQGWDGVLKPLLAAYTWSSSNTDATGYFYNSSSGMGVRGYSSGYIGAAGYGYGYGAYGNASASTGQGVRGYASGTAAYGVYAYAPNNVGVYGRGGTGSGDYGGYFYGFEGVMGVATGSNGYGTWGNAYGTYGIGAFGYAPYNIGVYGRGGSGSGDYGGYFYGYTGVYGRGFGTSQRGVYGYASASAGEGVRGYTAGYGGDGVTAYATNSYGYGFDSGASGYGGYGIRALASGTYGYGAYFGSSRYRGLFANGASGYYDAYFPDVIRVGSTVISGYGMSVFAINGGAEALEPGDLVALSGLAASDEATMAVAKANDANRGAIIGIVQSAYVKEAPVAMQPPLTAVAEAVPEAMTADVAAKENAPLPEAEVLPGEESSPEAPLPRLPMEFELEIEPEVMPDLAAPMQEESMVDADAGHFVEGSAEPGQYVVILVQGIAQVKVDASMAPVLAGDMLVASGAGYAQTASLADMDALGQAQPMIIGRALESLEEGIGTIFVLVGLR